MFSCKACLALTLIAAGAGKAAVLVDVDSTIRRFTHFAISRRPLRWLSLSLVLIELFLGASSLVLPTIRVLDFGVAAATCSFVVATIIGYALHRGTICNCFGAISKHTFDLVAIVRSSVLLAAAVVVVLDHVAVGPPRTTQQALLIATAVLAALATNVASRGLSALPTQEAGR